jgi:hypothetical protein
MKNGVPEMEIDMVSNWARRVDGGGYVVLKEVDGRTENQATRDYTALIEIISLLFTELGLMPSFNGFECVVVRVNW